MEFSNDIPSDERKQILDILLGIGHEKFFNIVHAKVLELSNGNSDFKAYEMFFFPSTLGCARRYLDEALFIVF